MNSSSTPFIRAILDRKTSLLVLAFMFFLGTVHISSAQGNDLESAASKIDKLIAKKKRTKIIVTDFFGPKNGVSEYGQAIANELSAELAKADPSLNVLPRNGQAFTFGNSSFSNDFTESTTACMLARSAGAEVVVTGNLKEHSDTVDISLRVWGIPTEQDLVGADKLGEFAARLSITPEQKVSLGRTIPQNSPNGFRLTAGKKTSADPSIPTCISCLPPMEEGKAEVNLLISISATGVVTDVELVSTSNQKIGEKVVRAAMKWRFLPARGPDGQPIAAKIPFNISLGNKFN
jgi:TonB family protein